MSLRVLIVDDSAVFRRMVRATLEGIAGIDIIGVCPNGRMALERIRDQSPDLVTLDIEMPEVNGLEVLKEMRRTGLQAAVVVVSGLDDTARHLTMQALQLGAFDFISKPQCAKPEEGILALRELLTPLVSAIAHRKEVWSLLHTDPGEPSGNTQPAPPVTHLVRPEPAPPIAQVPVPSPADGLGDTATRMMRLASRVRPALVLIGVSTGGPVALTRVIPQLPENLPVPVMIVQHMPPMFTRNLADSLNSQSALHVKEAEDGETALPGRVYLAPGDRHMKPVPGPKGAIQVRLTKDPPENNCRPAVDYLFRAAALAFPGRSVAVVLTGMGRDGTSGLRVLKAGGCFSIAQDEASCVVYGMPKEAIQAGVVDLVAPLDAIAAEIVRAVQ